MKHYFPDFKRSKNIFLQKRALLKMKKCSTRLTDTLSEVDLFAQEVKLTYKGK